MTSSAAKNRALTISLVLTAIGLALSLYLTVVHVHVKAGGGGGSLCNVSQYLSCDAAATSRYSEIGGVPIAVVGAAFYAAVIVFAGALAMRRRRGDERGEPMLALLLLAHTLALAYSIALLAVSVLELRHLCPACAGTYVVNAANLACAWIAFGGSPRRGLAIVSAKVGGLLGDAAVMLALVTFALLLAAGTISTRFVVGKAAAAQASRASQGKDLGAARAAHAPSLGPQDAPVVMVVFSDFQCPFCARLAVVLSRLHQAFPEQLRVEFRNFPLEFHRYANLAARAAICAHAEGRFWPLHDQLFGQQEKLSDDTLPLIIDDAGLNASAIMACAQSSEAKDVLAQDIAAGEKIDIQGTPAIVLNGRLFNGFVPYPELERFVRDALQSTERAEVRP